MPTQPPSYFERIRRDAQLRWERLEADPIIAAPWRQLFNQVAQSPRHVLSELLQNADDAGASNASVTVADGEFLFQHNGEDFKPEHFESLCRFGYSNKRALHTIGFRGIGFKSVFSLGDEVRIRTPTLSVKFGRDRFTEPVWIETTGERSHTTTVSVSIADRHRQKEVETNLVEWSLSGVSLLFFRHLRQLTILGQTIRWDSAGQGPTQESEWMQRSGSGERVLIARSEEVPFPAEALDEIRQEKLVTADQLTDFPAVRVELVLGVEGRLFAVLPTGVRTGLPYCCNAPFVQDPARLKIKDPAVSVTNRWLLERVGLLASQTMLAWLRADIPVEDRSRAYALMVGPKTADGSLESSCETQVLGSFSQDIAGQAFVLSQSGELHKTGNCISVFRELLEVWPEAEVIRLFAESGRALLSNKIAAGHVRALTLSGAAEQLSRAEMFAALASKRPAKPAQWSDLMTLWSFLGPELMSWQRQSYSGVRIVPAQGRDDLLSAAEVCRLGDKKLLQSADDWDFVSPYIKVLNPNWPRFLAEQRRTTDAGNDRFKHVQTATSVLRDLGLDNATDASSMVSQAARAFFATNQEPQAYIRFAQIAAKLEATVDDNFRFLNRNGGLKPVSEGLLSDPDGSLVDILPESWVDAHVIDFRYESAFTSCTAAEWDAWVTSGQSGVTRLPRLEDRVFTSWNRDLFEKRLTEKGAPGKLSYPYSTRRAYRSQSYSVIDFDFSSELISAWTNRDDGVWAQVVGILLSGPTSQWDGKAFVEARQTDTNGNVYDHVRMERRIPSAWIRRLRDISCLPDTNGKLRRPAELLLRTAATEPFLNVEPFVAGRLDTPRNRPLLVTLGLRDQPLDATSLLENLRSLSGSKVPPHEVDKWYRRLDQVVSTASTEQVADILAAFRHEALILSTTGWETAGRVFLLPEDPDSIDLPLIRPSVFDLSLWRRIGIADEVSVEAAIGWLQGLQSGASLSREDEKRANALSRRFPHKIWTECEHWISLSHEWVPTREISYALTMQSMVEWLHLHDSVKRATADLRLPSDIVSSSPFASIPTLASMLEDRIISSSRPVAVQLPWLTALGEGLSRVSLETRDETYRVNEFGRLLAKAEFFAHDQLEVVPYLRGTPAGVPRRAEAVWDGAAVHFAKASKPKLAKVIPERLAKLVGTPDVAAALSFSFDRSPEAVAEYVAANFDVAAAPTLPAGAPEVEKKEPVVREVSGVEQLQAVDEQRDLPDDQLPAPDESEETVRPDQREGRHQRPKGPTLADRFAASLGFKARVDGVFVHADGRRLVKTNEAFPWAIVNPSGEVLRRFWLRDQCLTASAIEVPAEIWNLLELAGRDYSLVTCDETGAPSELSGEAVQSLRASGAIRVHPASYRVSRDDVT